jgi:hypothetical protein
MNLKSNLNATPNALSAIEDKHKRNITLSKRKRGLMKKLIEFSSLCKLDLYFLAFDKEKQKLIEFRSSHKFNLKKVQSLLVPEIKEQFQHQIYTNRDYQKFVRKNDKEESENEE